MDADGADPTRLTVDAGADRYPAWSPDGSAIAFSSDRSGNREIYTMTADGSGVTNLTNRAGVDDFPSWQPVCTVRGTNRYDKLSGTPGDDLICGLGGTDTIKAGGGDDVVFGAAGADVLFGGWATTSCRGTGADRLGAVRGRIVSAG